MSEKIRESISVVAPTNPQLITATANGTGVLLDTSRRFAALVFVGAVTGTNPIIVRLQSSTDNTTWVNVAGKAVTVTSPANKQVLLECAGDELPDPHKYLRYQIDLNGNTNAQVAACAVLGDLRYYPAQHAGTVTAEG